ncbi:MAG: hypothetical protein P4L34_04185 [Paludibacter sp.]|nr:hypothetical protein [Paludibacter sp.]
MSSYLKDRDGKNWHDDEAFYLKPTFDGYTGLLNCIEHLSKDYTLNIHTLNHDLFFERLNNTEWLNGNLSDGFEELNSPYYGKLLHDNRNYMCRLSRYTGKYTGKIRFYKLHGSKDYYVYSGTQGNAFIPENYIKSKWGVGSTNFYKEKMDKDGNIIYENCWVNYHSDFLTGTSSKIIRYREPLLYKQLFKMFENNIKAADMLIIIGYGCKDTEINKILIEKFGKGKPCYIVDPFAGDLVKSFVAQIGSSAKLVIKQLETLKITDLNPKMS